MYKLCRHYCRNMNSPSLDYAWGCVNTVCVQRSMCLTCSMLFLVRIQAPSRWPLTMIYLTPHDQWIDTRYCPFSDNLCFFWLTPYCLPCLICPWIQTRSTSACPLPGVVVSVSRLTFSCQPLGFCVPQTQFSLKVWYPAPKPPCMVTTLLPIPSLLTWP